MNALIYLYWRYQKVGWTKLTAYMGMAGAFFFAPLMAVLMLVSGLFNRDLLGFALLCYPLLVLMIWWLFRSNKDKVAKEMDSLNKMGKGQIAEKNRRMWIFLCASLVFFILSIIIRSWINPHN